MEQQVSQRSIKKYMVLFPVLALLVCFAILKGADMESVWNAMKSAKPQWLAAGLILAAVFNIAEAINLRSVLNSFGYQVSFRQGMKYAYTGYFFRSEEHTSELQSLSRSSYAVFCLKKKKSK